MKQNHLLPYKFKKAGTIMFLPFLVICIWLLLGPCECDYLKVPALALFEDGYLFSTRSFTSTTTDPINEIAMLGLLVSIVFIALSREKDEDEMAPVERQRAFIWSFWIIYIIRFNLAMHKLRRELK